MYIPIGTQRAFHWRFPADPFHQEEEEEEGEEATYCFLIHSTRRSLPTHSSDRRRSREEEEKFSDLVWGATSGPFGSSGCDPPRALLIFSSCSLSSTSFGIFVDLQHLLLRLLVHLVKFTTMTCFLAFIHSFNSVHTIVHHSFSVYLM